MIKILVVDDSLLELEIVSAALSQKGFECVTLSEPERAIEVAEKETPDVIILDLFMPGYSGFDICKQIKTNPSTVDIPVMFLTADESSESVLKGVHLGVVDYLHKPIRPQELADAIVAQDAAKQLRGIFSALKAKAKEMEEKYT